MTRLSVGCEVIGCAVRLPHYEQAIVPEQKIVAYLLSFTHTDGRSKALYFSRFGFMVDRWEEFADALKQHAATNDVVESEGSAYGNIVRCRWTTHYTGFA